MADNKSGNRHEIPGDVRKPQTAMQIKGGGGCRCREGGSSLLVGRYVIINVDIMIIGQAKKMFSTEPLLPAVPTSHLPKLTGMVIGVK